MGRRVIIGFTLALALVACGSSGSHSSAANDNPPNPQSSLGGEQHHRTTVGLQGVQPFRADGPYVEQLRRCALAQTEQQSCTFEQLPLLGMDQVYPSVDDIMDRVLVSHQWMGQRFEQMLHALPADVRVLMKPITAIVLAEDIRPSYYWSLTGAVYIDAYHLWLSAEEKSTFVDELVVTDNNEVAGPLAFHAWWRYVKDEEFAYRMWDDWEADHRDLTATVMPMAATLFHELAHANDYFPPAEIDRIPQDWTVVKARRQLQERRASHALYREAPLTSALMFEVAQGIHRHAELTGEAATLTAEEVGLAFQMDFANDDYAYISRFEDVAMLFEETMMQRHFGVARDIAYISRPEQEAEANCDDFAVAWGMRGRIGDPGVQPRAQLVAEALMPMRQWQDFFTALPAPQFLAFGVGWCQSLLTGDDAAAHAEPSHRLLSDDGFVQQRLYRPLR